MAKVRGGEKWQRELDRLAERVKTGVAVEIGFLPGASYPDGKPVALIAALNEYGHVIMPPDSLSLPQGARRRLRARQMAAGHTVPPRPFFRQMISEHSGEWGQQTAKALKAHDWDGAAALDDMGALIKGELVQSINTFEGVPLAPSTIARKGHAKQLIESGHMLRSVDYQVRSK